MSRVTTDYLSVGGNRHSAAADWSHRSGVLAFGADNKIALWRPLDEETRGVFALLSGHKAKVHAVHFHWDSLQTETEFVISADADGEIRVFNFSADRGWETSCTIKGHNGAIKCINSLDNSDLIVTGGADATIKLWRLTGEGSLTLVHTLATKPRYIPLCLAVGRFINTKTSDAAFLAAAGTRNEVFVYSLQKLPSGLQIELAATLKGHEGWVRSLALTSQSNGDQLLASASADKYVRLWKFTREASQAQPISVDTADVGVHHDALSAKVQKVGVPGAGYSITFESLLLGHEDWVYSAAWSPEKEQPQLLTASADGTVTIWESDPTSGIWVSASRLGEISGQKGATTATGSAGGFWNALWSPDAHAVTCLGRTGSWRLWQYDQSLQYWVQKPAVSGHISSVNGISWSLDGAYLLSTSSDQTTRLHAEWRRGTKRTWHEFARPQIHGYDLNCITCIGPSQFTSGADEKLLRVFDEPKDIAKMLHKLCKIEVPAEEHLPETAAIPVLGLSNKAVDETNGDVNGDADAQPSTTVHESSGEDLIEPPTEDLLARHTLWPEREKLYGHGYEISEVAVNNDQSLLATSCKASSLDHAVIRLYDTKTWTEIKPPLSAHTLTITRLAFPRSPDRYLLSVGRDRQWAIFEQFKDSNEWKLIQSNPKAHTRMILDAAWHPGEGKSFFVTAGRDKTVKVWVPESTSPATFTLRHTISRKSAVSAVALTSGTNHEQAYLAVGEDDGTISIFEIDVTNFPTLGEPTAIVPISQQVCPSKTVNRLAWRPNASEYTNDGVGILLAVASADSSVRILRVTTGNMIHEGSNGVA